MKVKILLFLQLLLFNAMYGQDYNNLYFEHINNTHGLLSDEVYTTVQDKNGFIWFGTAEGIVRFDGYEFESFKNHYHLGKLYGIVITSIHVDKQGNYLVTTDDGFYAFNRFFEPILQFAEKYFKGVKLNNVIKASDGTIYMCSQTGFYIIDEESNSVSVVRPSKTMNISNNNTKQIVEDHKGQIWVTSWSNNLLKLNKDKKSFTNFPLFNPSEKAGYDLATNALFIDNRGYLWVGSWDRGLFVLDISGDSVNVIKTFEHDGNNPNSIPGDIILTICEDSYNNIWIGTPYGLSIIQYPLSKSHKIVNYTPEDKNGSVSSTIINSVFNDNSNILWVATKGGGVEKLIIERNKFEHLKIPNLFPQRRNQAVHTFEIDHKGRLLAGVLSIGFVVYDMNKKEFKHYQDIPEYKILDDFINLNTVKDFMWDRDSLLWIGTRYNGLVLLDVKKKTVQVLRNRLKRQQYRGRKVNVLHPLQNGSVLVGTEDCLNLLIKGKNNNWNSRYIDLREAAGVSSASFSISGIVSIDGKNVLVASELYGLYKLSFNKGKVDVKKWGQFEDKIVTLFKDNRGKIWIGTKGSGLKYINPNSTEILSPNPETNIIGDVIYGVNQDKYDNIWVTTNQGVSKIWTQQPELSSESYFYRDGLQGNVFLPRSFYKDKEGRFYVGGYNGFNIFEPHRIKSDNVKAPVAITDILIEGEQLSLSGLKDSVLHMDHLRNDLSISFSSLSYTFPEANQYAYKIKGLDKDWKYANSKMRSANYSNIPAGEYTFVLKGSNSQGVWNEDAVKLSISVDRAPYKSWWAISLYVVFIGLLALFIFRQRLRIERAKQNMELEQVARIKSEKLNQYKLSFFTNISHELLTPISILATSLYNIKEQKEYREDTVSVMERSIAGLERLIKQLLTFRKVETNSMKVSMAHENVSEIVNNCVKDFKPVADKKNISIAIKIEDGIEGKIDKEKWELIIRNLLSNAIKYTPQKGNIWLTLSKSDAANVNIIVKDSGCGIPQDALPYLFDRFYRVKSKASTKSEGIGIGLNLTKSLIDILKGTIDVESKEGQGALFTVVLPIDGSYEKDFANNDVEKIKGDEVSTVVDTDFENEQDSIYEERKVDLTGKTILLVEDNDEFRQSLKGALASKYKILEAEDGKKGIQIAEKEEIDLVISDVMMPNMSGHELCQALKTNINTSHIPVILLTAKVGDENRLAGYQSGANSYLEKPVNMKLLLVRIQALLMNFQNQREKTAVSLNLEPENVTITPLDEEFFNKAKKIVEDNISDAEYSIKDFAKELGVSNSMLYRKMKNLASCSPSEFVRNIRLRRAAQLFDNKTFQISEVAYKCGFNDLSYFGVCFKKMYGVTPTQYQEGKRKDN
ncbi:hybrid sensor histidine kinase/response regulator transcription factor [Saccharicrinis sp. 156]|uniref:hybrid sensor histidine kinase/response regulator transcription factor n=1 Tax=Saccharicrinis sp. 156 TaxID=3417574 RepID=UPI003D35117C